MMYYTGWGKEYKLFFKRQEYAVDNSLAIQVYCEDEEGFIEPFCTLTKHLGVTPSKPNVAYIDCNNTPMEIRDNLIDEGVMTYTGNAMRSGYCTYFEAEFSTEWLESL